MSQHPSDMDTRLAQLEAILAHTDDLLAFLDRGLRYRVVSDKLLRLRNLSQDQLIGHTVAEVLGAEHFERHLRHHYQAALAGERVSYDAWYQLPGTDRRHFEIVYQPARDARGAVQGVVLTARDTTLQEEALQALRRSELRHQAAEQVANIGSWELDLVTGALWWSDQVYRIFEVLPHQFEATYPAFLERVHPDDRDQLNDAYQTSVLEHTPYELRHRLLLANDTLRHVVERGQTFYDADGTPLRSVGTVQDVTDRVLAEQQAARDRAALVQARKMETLGKLAGGVAHDFNNMLGVIRGYTEMVIEDLDPTSPVWADLQEIRNAALRASRLTGQLQAFARQQPMVPEKVDANAHISQFLSMLSRLLGEQIDLEWHPGPEVGGVLTTPAQLDQVLLNLCVNARDAIGGVGNLRISSARRQVTTPASETFPEAGPGTYVRLRVQDSGPGIPPDVIEHIFEPFFTTKASGTGMGLATVFGVVRQHGGFVTVDSPPGQGATFNVYLPATDGAAPAPQRPTEPPSARYLGRTALVVDDEESLVILVSRMLEPMGFRVLQALLPSQALALIDQLDTPIDLVISDMIMPEMDGVELLREIRRRAPEARSLLMSGYTGRISEPDILHKPFNRATLQDRVRLVMDQAFE